MKPHSFSFLTPSIGVLLLASLPILGCTRSGYADAYLPPSDPSATIQSFNPANRSQYRTLYAVYCNGTVDRLDLVQRKKIDSFQLSERSGNPPAVAALPFPGPGARTGHCLARPVLTGGIQEQAAGMVHIVASDNRDFDDQRRADFSLLTFMLPDWTLQHVRELGNFSLLNGSEPRMLSAPDGAVALQARTIYNADGTYIHQSDSNPWNEMFHRIKTYTGAENLNWDRSSISTDIFEWSADNVLFRYSYRLPDREGISSFPDGYGIALANHSRRDIVLLDEFPKESFPILPTPYLAPGGQFVLMVMPRNVSFGRGDMGKIENSGELRLYAANGRQLAAWMEPAIEGETLAQVGKLEFDELMMFGRDNANDWYPIALTPDGQAVFTNRRGDYRFIALGQTFGVGPVVNPGTDDQGRTRPGIVYARQ